MLLTDLAQEYGPSLKSESESYTPALRFYLHILISLNMRTKLTQLTEMLLLISIELSYKSKFFFFSFIMESK